MTAAVDINAMGDMNNFNAVFGHLSASADELAEFEQNVGREVRFKGTKSSDGLVHKHLHKIVGIQRDFKGDVCYRVVSLEYDDRFGHVMSMDRVQFEDETND